MSPTPSKTDPHNATMAPVAVTSFKTPKGQEVWYVQSDVVPLIALSFIFEGGASQESAHKAGAAQMMTSLLDEGAGPYSSEEFQERLASHAIELSFSASIDSVSGSLRSLEKNAEEAFDLLRLALTSPTFDSVAIERIRSQIIAGLKHQQNDPASISSKLFFEKAFPGHPYAYPISGTLETIPTIHRDDLTVLHRLLFGKGRVKIAAAGSLDPKVLANLIDKVFSDLPSAQPLKAIPQISISNIGKQFISEVDVPQSVIRFGMNGIPRLDKDFIPSYVFNHIFGGGIFSSRLFVEVREKRGLAYSIGTGLSSYRSAAITAGYTATKNERVQECLDVISEQIIKLKNEGVTEDELQKAKDYLTGSYLLAFDTSTKIASRLSGLAFEGLGIDYISNRNQKILDVTQDDIKRVASRILGDGEFLSIIVGKPVNLRKK